MSAAARRWPVTRAAAARTALTALAALVALAALTALTTGCGASMTKDANEAHGAPSDEGDDGDGTGPVAEKPVEMAREELRALSDQLLELAAPADGATVTDPGPGVDVCAEDPDRERLFTLYHAWGVHRLPRADLERAMDRLRQHLPAEGWLVTEDGVLNNANRSPRLLLEHPGLHTAADITLAGRGDDSQLRVTLQTACFSTPEGESPAGEY
ncbi:hypothetical protein MTQ13_07680 [Streptomyces sp. XM4011]|uniref:hypothetical protein n=1 Tax=Streptomyces sp. XM4011 TaxID=2929780 RepID=UPI001FFAAD98|nr:hypothetical protein [Streptomyces sp. XM4011]MCK1814158.1 hypothetical protein [Streptomyces sp. XM4011]